MNGSIRRPAAAGKDSLLSGWELAGYLPAPPYKTV
ncbi:hypothetical protein CLOBOL_02377 [Enterocloster bolteae ATCC BAA-613]|uniref:Uncharacterized protein n=1 Tax=Enterocloster bolteae (strain ATCC BAA-613 / DSM 15670 / CCUG 46953 / JCM 12243 / WAL 16351) TaxID=411902 RepID=A8RP60_ENTBW|nr:hypothetical protein CLOBOL_02377 [Enterocloster bolteae ATCC BAA-613]